MSRVSDLVSLLQSPDGEAELAVLRVRTEAGAQRYGQPIGSIVEKDAYEQSGTRPSARTAVRSVRNKLIETKQTELKVPAAKDKKQAEPSQGEQAPKLRSRDKKEMTAAKGALVKLLLQKGALEARADIAVEQLAKGSTAAQLQLFMNRLKGIEQGNLPAQLENIDFDPAAEAPAAKDPQSQDAPPQIDAVEEDKKGEVKTEIFHWKGRDVRVPVGARVGTLPPQVPGTPAFFFWYDPETGMVSGVDDSGNNVPSRKLPSGNSVRKFFASLDEVGGVKHGIYTKAGKGTSHMIVYKDGTGKQVNQYGETKDLTGKQVRSRFIKGVSEEVKSLPKKRKRPEVKLAGIDMPLIFVPDFQDESVALTTEEAPDDQAVPETIDNDIDDSIGEEVVDSSELPDTGSDSVSDPEPPSVPEDVEEGGEVPDVQEEASGEVVEDVDDHNDVIDSTEEEVVTDSVDSEGEEDA